MSLALNLGGISLLDVKQMYQADRLAVNAGIPSIKLMENACAAVAAEIRTRWSPRRTLVLCGPGNNGGDGLGVATLLREARWPVEVALFGSSDAFKADAAIMAQRWIGPFVDFDATQLDDVVLVVDALFGAGLQRPIEGRARAMLEGAVERELEIVAVDMPSGVHGDTGKILGFAATSSVTVTFFRPKPGHMLLPGRDFRGQLIVSDIGIPVAVLDEIDPKQWLNGPNLWSAFWPWPGSNTHKYHRGHALVQGGGMDSTGAARLAAESALKIGAGLVTIAAPTEALGIYGAQLTSVMLRAVDDAVGYKALLDDDRKNAVLIGPGCGVNAVTESRVLETLATGKACVLDADALTVFVKNPNRLFQGIKGACVLTPHDGEYRRLFDTKGDRLSRARAAAEVSGSVVLLKGADSVIAAPDGRAAIVVNAPPHLATAGSGDVLAGLVLGLLAQGCDPYYAACMAGWVHGEAGRRFGVGVVSEDLVLVLPEILEEMLTTHYLVSD